MRAIKFRAWDKRNLMMIDLGHLVINRMSKYNVYAVVGDLGNTLHKNDYEIMQFTGLKDKNGVEVYFDDIVKFCFHDENDENSMYEGTAVITESITYGVGILFDYDEWPYQKVWAVIEGGVIEDLWEDDNLWTVEVIGNIYENPELLASERTE